MIKGGVHIWYKRQVLLILSALISCTSFAYDFEVDGLCYNIIGSNQVEVTYRNPDGGSYSGTLQIPESVIYNDVTYQVTSIGASAFSYCRGLTGSLAIPNTVSTIGDHAFFCCSGFTGSLVIPNSVTTIGNCAFESCNGFNGSLTIPNSVTYIGAFAFSSCNGFTGSLIIPNSVNTIGSWAFYYCSGFSGSLTIPNTITSVEDNTFQGCSGLTGSLTISNSVKTIGSTAFAGCGFTGSLNIPNSVTSIGADAFGSCRGFKGSLTIPNSVKTIDSWAFSYCNGFTGVTIPNSVTSIGDAAFKGCNILENVYSNIVSPFSIGDNTFEEISSTANLHIPKGTKSSYQQYSGWVNNFKYILEEGEIIPAETYSLSITSSGNGYTSYEGETIRGETKTFTVNEGTSASLSFNPDSGYRIKSLKVNGSNVTVSSSYTTTINADTSIEVEFEAIPPTTYTLTLTATGNGTTNYGGSAIRGRSSSFTVNDGTSVTITFEPDTGYRIQSVKVNNTDVTSNLSNNTYTFNVTSDTSVEVVFEAIPKTTFTLTLTATGNGTANYGGSYIRGRSSSFIVNDGTSVTVTFEPDTGYRVKSAKVNGSDITSKLSNNSYTFNVASDTSVEVVFEAIPQDPDIPKTYTLSIRAKGNGIATYNGETIRATTKTYTLEEGTKVSLTFTPDEGNQIKSLRVNEEYINVTDSYEVTISADTYIKIDFEEIPLATYTLSIKAKGNGIAMYKDETIRDNTSTFTLNEGTTGTITFTPDEGYHIMNLMINGSAINVDTIYDFTMNSDTSVEVEFEVTIVEREFTIDGTNYEITSFEDHTVILEAGDYGLILEVPEKVNYQDEEWIVTGIAEGALDQCEDLAAIIWNIEKTFNARIANPNLLLYVKNEAYASSTIKNVVANGFAKAITLTDAQSGNNFYCPEAFIAQSVVYTHNYSMKTGLNESRGWETIALPFDVQLISHSSKGEIEPFANWTSGSSTKPFWLYELSGSGFVEAEAIKANTPYIISMPNNENYPNEYQLAGKVTFSALNAEVKKSDEIQSASFGNHTFAPTFINLGSELGYYALNVNNDQENYKGSDNEGSKFVLNLRKIHPFEAYMTSTSNTRSIDIFDNMTTGIRGIEEIVASDMTIKVYDLSGRLVKTGTTIEAIRKELPTGVYIVNNRKMIIK